MNDPNHAEIEWLPTNLTAVGGETQHYLTNWVATSMAPDAVTEPLSLDSNGRTWTPVSVPGTVGDLPGDGDPTASDHWYRCRFDRPVEPAARTRLCFDGLTMAEVWLNGSVLFRSTNMFHVRSIDVTDRLESTNELALRFPAMGPWLDRKRARGRWPTRLVSHKNLRFLRTTLLGHMPGWYPAPPPVGPWRPVRLVCQRAISVSAVRVLATWASDDHGVLDLALTVHSLESGGIDQARLRVTGAGEWPLECTPGPSPDEVTIQGRHVLTEVSPWWPHTHGEPRLYPVEVELFTGSGPIRIALGQVGFRRIELAGQLDDFRLECNGRPIFCRGACWSPLDVTHLDASEAAYRHALEQVRAAGMNMVRVPGIAAYESETFYRLCDEIGLLVWQDFMFANMDYPVEDPDFLSSCDVEARQLVERLRTHPCLAVLCGNSEVAQQAAMMGMPAPMQSNPLFDEILPALCRELGADVPYVPSTPYGGTLPFHVDRGPSHYYGVGAYRRSTADVHQARVRFASECLAFSNPPDTASLHTLMGSAGPAPHHPLYKAHVPRDPQVGWDFADVTDHYVEDRFGAGSSQVRAYDPERYWSLCRAAVGSVAAETVGIWRREHDPCSGCLVWMLHDVAPGAGWGIVGSDGRPKSLYHYLKRAWAPTALWWVDEGLSGLVLYGANDSPHPVRGELHLTLYRSDAVVVARHTEAVVFAAHQYCSWPVERLLGSFFDANYAYRFGPPPHEVVVARFEATSDFAGDLASLRPFYRVGGVTKTIRYDLDLQAQAYTEINGSYAVTLKAQRFAQAVAFEVQDYVASDDHFDLEPYVPYTVHLRPLPGARPLLARVRALNGPASIPVNVSPRKALP